MPKALSLPTPQRCGPRHRNLKLFTTLLCATYLTACSSIRPVTDSKPHPVPTALSPLSCTSASDYLGRVLGNGHCVDFIRACTTTPPTSAWQPGPALYKNVNNTAVALYPQVLTSGTVIATFRNGKYPSTRGYHAAVYLSHDHRGILVWDQYKGKSVGQRLIRVRYDGAYPSNTAQDYRVVTLTE